MQREHRLPEFLEAEAQRDPCVSIVLQSLSWHSQADKEAVGALYARVQDQRLWNLASANDSHAMVAHALLESCGEVVPEHWRHCHEENERKIRAFLQELDGVADGLARAGIRLVALKNAGIARGIYPCLGCCPMGDVDVLVRREDFNEAHRYLLARGFQFRLRCDAASGIEAAEQAGGAEYRKVLGTGHTLWFELQWRPVAGRWLRPDQEPDAHELLRRSQPIPGTMVRLLGVEDNLIQVALHTAKHSYVRAPGLRLHCDVERIVRFQNIDWRQFLAKVTTLQVKTPVYFSLAIPRAIFGTPVPDGVLKALEPPVLKRKAVSAWIRRVGLFNSGRKFNNAEYIAFTALLYDDIKGFGAALFPNSAWMRERYRFSSSFFLPAYHVRRLLDLAFRRTL